MAETRLFSRSDLIGKFDWLEYSAVASLLTLSAAIGLYFWRKGQKTKEDLLLGGRSMGVLPVTLSLFVSFFSAISILGTPAEIYVYGVPYLLLIITMPLAVVTVAAVYLPVFYKLGSTTVYEYLELRFSKPVRILASVLFSFQAVLYLAVVVYAPSLALSQITDFDEDLACLLVFIVCIFYTSLGGIKAVMWTDTLQALVIFISVFGVLGKGSFEAGGLHKVFEANYQTGRLDLFDASFDPTVRYTFWNCLIGGYFFSLALYGVNQTQVQRYLTLPKLKMAKKSLWFTSFFSIGSGFLLGLGGMVIYAYYYLARCDPIKTKMISKSDQLFPLFVMQIMGDVPLIPGLFVAGLFSGSLSSVSSGLNSLAAVAMEDLIKSVGKSDGMSDRAEVTTTRLLAVAFGILSYGVIHLIKLFPGLIAATIAILGSVGGPLLGMFTLGMMVPWANSTGVIVGSIVSITFTFFLGFGQTVSEALGYIKRPPMPLLLDGCPDSWLNFTQDSIPSQESSFSHLPIYEISNVWYSVIGFSLCFSIGALLSLVTGPQNPRTLNPDLISPAFSHVINRFPHWLSRKESLQIGADFEILPKGDEKRNQIADPVENIEI